MRAIPGSMARRPEFHCRSIRVCVAAAAWRARGVLARKGHRGNMETADAYVLTEHLGTPATSTQSVIRGGLPSESVRPDRRRK